MPFDAVLSAEGLAAGLPYALSLIAILGAHEMGHYIACRRHGIDATLPYFIPGPPIAGTFGAVIRIRGPIPNRNALFDVAAAGPIAGFVVALPLLVWGVYRAVPVPEPPQSGALLLGDPLVAVLLARLVHGGADLAVGPIYGAAWTGILVTSLNLFPSGQLDGGHAVYALSVRAHRIASRLTPWILAGLVAVESVRYRAPSGYIAWLIVLFILRDRHPALLDEGAPLGRGRRALGLLLALIFAACFIPLPLRFI